MTQTDSGPKWVSGDFMYGAIFTPNAQVTKDFFVSLLDWEVERVESEYAEFDVVNLSIQHSICESAGEPDFFVGYYTSDIESAIRALGDSKVVIKGEYFEEDGGYTVGLQLSTGHHTSLYQYVDPTKNVAGTRAGQPEVLGVSIPAKDPRQYVSDLGTAVGGRRLTDQGTISETTPSVHLVQAARLHSIPIYRTNDLRGADDRVRTLGGMADESEWTVPDTRLFRDPTGFQFALGE